MIDDVASTDVFSVFDPELQVLLSEFKVGVRRYLSTVSRSKMHNLADLIEFNTQHCNEELVYFGQELFEMAQATSGLDDPAYTAARATCLTLTRQQGIDRAFRQHRLDALIGPTFGVASTAPAVAGYPHVSVPAGFDADGVPVGASLFAQPWDEGKLLGFAFALSSARRASAAHRVCGARCHRRPRPSTAAYPVALPALAPTRRPRPASDPGAPGPAADQSAGGRARAHDAGRVGSARGVWRGLDRAGETQPRQKPPSGSGSGGVTSAPWLRASARDFATPGPCSGVGAGQPDAPQHLPAGPGDRPLTARWKDRYALHPC